MALSKGRRKKKKKANGDRREAIRWCFCLYLRRILMVNENYVHLSVDIKLFFATFWWQRFHSTINIIINGIPSAQIRSLVELKRRFFNLQSSSLCRCISFISNRFTFSSLFLFRFVFFYYYKLDGSVLRLLHQKVVKVQRHQTTKSRNAFWLIVYGLYATYTQFCTALDNAIEKTQTKI